MTSGTNVGFCGPLSPFERHFCFLCASLICASLVTSASEVVQLFSGSAITTVKVTSALRLIREAIFFLILADFLLLILTTPRSPLISRGTVLCASATLAWVGICAYVSLAIGLPLLVIITGLRFIEYVPLVLVAVVTYRIGSDRPFAKIGKVIFFFLLVESVAGLIETRLPIPFWGRTFIGARSFGTFTSPNIFGPTMAFCYLYVRATLSSRWHRLAFPIVLFDVFASGSRAGVVSFVIIVGIYGLSSLRNIWMRAFALLASVVSAPLFLLLVTSPAITGRATGLGVGGYERIGVWSQMLTKINSVSDFLLGWGVGLGSNTIFSIYGYDFKGAYISDNTLFFLQGSFGFIGVVFFVFTLGWLAWRLRDDPAGLAGVAAFTLLLLVSQALEVYPVNVLAMILFGWRLAISSGSLECSSAPLVRPYERPSLQV
jgi:hypothetical protein